MERNIQKDNKPILNDINVNYNFFDKEEREIDLEDNLIESISSISGSNYFQENESQNDEKVNIATYENKIIYFLIDGEKIKQDNNFIFHNCPAIVNLLKNYKGKNKEIFIEMPKNITKEHIYVFYQYIKNPILFIAQISNNQLYLLKLFKMSLYFENKLIINKIINEEIIKVTNEKNVVLFYKFVKENLKIEKKSENIDYYLRIMYLIKPVIINNFQNLINDKNFNNTIEKNDIVEFLNLFCLKKKLQVDESIIEYICNFYGYSLNKLLFLISYLYDENFQKEKIYNKLKKVPIKKIELNPKKNYEEFKIDSDNNTIFFETLLEKKDMRSLITYKTKDIAVYILSIFYINENNPIINFCKYSSYQVKLKENEKKEIKMKLKLDYLFTSIFNYFISKTNNYINSYGEIGNINYNLIQDIFQAFKSNHINSNVSLLCFMKLIDNINLNENENIDINLLLKNINFREVSLEVLSEFYIKYLTTEKLSSDIIIFVNKILKENNLSKLINYLAKNIKINNEPKNSFNKLLITKEDFKINSFHNINQLEDNKICNTTINSNYYYISKTKDSFSEKKARSFMNSLIQENIMLKKKDNRINNSILPKKPSLNSVNNNKINSFNKSRIRSQTNLDKNFNIQLKTHQTFKSDIPSKIKKK